MSASLRLTDFGFQASVEPRRSQTLTVTRDGNIFEAQIDTHRGLCRISPLNGNRHRQANVPISYGILSKAPRLPLPIAANRSGSNTRNVFPQNLKYLPWRRILAALKGTHPKDRLDPELTRHRNLAFFV
jgi:hypothetical protein